MTRVDAHFHLMVLFQSHFTTFISTLTWEDIFGKYADSMNLTVYRLLLQAESAALVAVSIWRIHYCVSADSRSPLTS